MRKEFTIKDIESLTEEEAKELAEENITIKEHNIFFIDFGGYFGYSALVFADGMHIYHANDYGLHHKGKTRKELHYLYIKSLNKKIFTEEEFKIVNNYEEKRAKENYLFNYHSMRRNRISIFFIGSDKEREARKEKTDKMIYSSIFLAYYEKEDYDFVKSGEKMLKDLRKAERENNTVEYWKSAFLYEMLNHEYGINWQGDYDVCSCFGNCSSVIDYEDIDELFDACNFNEIKRNAYYLAKREYFKKAIL